MSNPFEKSSEARRILSPGHQIRTARHDLGLTLNQVSEKTGIAHSRLCYLEKNEDANPTLDTIKKVAEALGMCLTVEFMTLPDLIARADKFTYRRAERAKDELSYRTAKRILEEIGE